MTTLDAIRKRRSVRTFDGTALRAEDAQAIMEFSMNTENPYDIPITWKLLDAKKTGLSTPVITGEDTYIAGKMQRVPHAEEAFGYTFEKTVLFAETLGVGTTWIAGTMNRDSFEKAVNLADGEVMPCISPLGYPAKKMSLRETVMRKGVKADVRFDFKDLFFEKSFSSPLTEDRAGKLKEALKAVRLAPSAVNKQPWRVVIDGNKVHFYEKHGKGYTAEKGWDIQKIDMGIALCHFELAAKECVGDVVIFEIADPGIALPENTEYIASYILKQE